jgi:phenylalanyl-tRNA synthetase beta chain
LFETGLRFVAGADEVKQEKMLAGLALGAVHAEQWGEKTRNVDFFDVKADVEALLGQSLAQFEFKPAQHPALHPGQTAQIVDANGVVAGLIGMLHPNLEKQLGFDTPVFLFELSQDVMLQRKVPTFAPLSKFPSVRRDMALIVEHTVSANDIVNCIYDCKQEAVREVSIFDVYQGKGIEEGYKSVALSLVLQDFTQTLTDSEIDAIFRGLLDSLSAKLHAKLRE